MGARGAKIMDLKRQPAEMRASTGSLDRRRVDSDIGKKLEP